MMVGTSGGCIETCGDGKNFGLNVCDDGNLNNGDGCNNQCLIEKDYMCFGTI
jgi:cysteine-rich repeat protein